MSLKNKHYLPALRMTIGERINFELELSRLSLLRKEENQGTAALKLKK